MKELELYDIITLDDNTEYTIMQMIMYKNRKYCLIAPIDKEEEPDLENIKIVEEIKESGQILIQEETDEEYIKELAVEFSKQLEEEL